MDLSSIDINASSLGKDFTEHIIFSQLDDLINFFDTLFDTTMVL